MKHKEILIQPGQNLLDLAREHAGILSIEDLVTDLVRSPQMEEAMQGKTYATGDFAVYHLRGYTHPELPVWLNVALLSGKDAVDLSPTDNEHVFTGPQANLIDAPRVRELPARILRERVWETLHVFDPKKVDQELSECRWSPVLGGSAAAYLRERLFQCLSSLRLRSYVAVETRLPGTEGIAAHYHRFVGENEVLLLPLTFTHDPQNNGCRIGVYDGKTALPMIVPG